MVGRRSDLRFGRVRTGSDEDDFSPPDGTGPPITGKIKPSRSIKSVEIPLRRTDSGKPKGTAHPSGIAARDSRIARHLGSNDRRLNSTNPDETLDFPRQGRIAAIDFGSVRIGIAICDPDWILASPLEIFRIDGQQDHGKYFADLVRREAVAGFVVGLPIHCDGGESRKSLECREFARELAVQTGRPVRLFDEHFTTVAAKQRLAVGKLSRQKKKQRLDAVAALVLLESFLEATRYHGEIAGQPIHAPATGDQSLDATD